ncbi:MAG: hypothetical protein ACREQ4_02695 [Candidatus Binataceae bacterium]
MLHNQPRRWGIAWFYDDEVLAEPRLIAVRYRENGECQALYQTAINPRTGGRAFIADSAEPQSACEHTLAAILLREGSWHWEFVGAGVELLRTAQASGTAPQS